MPPSVRLPRMLLSQMLKWLLLAWLLGVGAKSMAVGVVLQELPAGALGLHAEVLVEVPARPLDLAQVQQGTAPFQPITQQKPSFGIGAAPRWIRLKVNNLDAQAQVFHLVAGVPWTDRIDGYLIQNGRTLTSWQTGDERPGAPGLVPGLGFTMALQLPPGQSEVLLRVACVDPMVVPLELLSPAQFEQRQRSTAYLYGLHYGFLLALCAYNLLLFAGLGKRTYLSYAVYLLCYIGVNVCYTGHGNAWIWPDLPGFQRYVIPVMMVAFAVSSLMFARRFLRLWASAQRVDRAVSGLALLGVIVATVSVLGGSHLAAVLWGFAFLGLVCVVMVALGFFSLHRGTPSARYFLLACLCGMIGAASSTITTWGWVPFNELGYRAIEIGVTLEATLLALALAYQVRHYQRASLQATELARIDPLTKLLNRRAFFEDCLPAWRTAGRGERPMCVVVIDLDHFKSVNDRHGHEVGDRALVAAGKVLAEGRRAGDLLARWGGEEFVLLLPETELAQAVALAERLRAEIEAVTLPTSSGMLSLSASFGVAQRADQASIEALIAAADTQLLAAKQAGRNRVSAAQQA